MQLHSYIPSQDSEVPVLNCGEENDLLCRQFEKPTLLADTSRTEPRSLMQLPKSSKGQSVTDFGKDISY